MSGGSTHVLALVASAFLILTVVPLATAGTAEDPEITDPTGDAEHFEFKNQEPTLDVEAVWFSWDPAGALEVTLEIPEADGFGPSATMDPSDEATFYDVYVNVSGEAYTVRANWTADGQATFSAGQALQIERQGVWPDWTTGNIHGNLTPVQGEAEPGEPARITMTVPGSALGGLGPGDVIEEPGFSTYVDHHTPPQPNAEQHHPGHVDQNDEPGRSFAITSQEGDGSGDGTESGSDDEDASGVPTVAMPAVILVGFGAALVLTRRR